MQTEILIAIYLSTAIFFLVLSGKNVSTGFRLANLTLVPFLSGFVLLVKCFSYFIELEELNTTDTDHLIKIGTAIVLSVLVLAGMEWLGEWICRTKYNTKRVLSTLIFDSTRIIFVGALFVMPNFFQKVQPNEPSSFKFVVDDSPLELVEYRKLPFSGPLGLTFKNTYEGYFTAGPDKIVFFKLPSNKNEKISVKVVAEGIKYPRGIAVVDNTLFVAELGPLPCDNPFPKCNKSSNPNIPRIEFEKKILSESRGRILAFSINSNGPISNKRVALDNLPVINTDHGLNQLSLGPDNKLYLSIGHLDQLQRQPEFISSLAHKGKHLLGTIVTFAADSATPEIFARGLRNVYGFTFGPGDNIFAVDNDGPTNRGWREEELIQVKRGAHYGFPDEGSFGPYRVRTDPPFWILDGVAPSTSIEWGRNIGLGAGFIIGFCGQLQHLLAKEHHNGELSVRGQGDQVGVRTIATFPGCATVLQADPQGRLILGSIFGNFIAVLQPRKNKTSDNAISRGKVLFGTLGCASCHSVLVDDKTRILTAPSLADVKLRAAKKVAGLNSEQYLRESIEHPAKFIVQGYSPTMPPTDSLDTKQMQSLIEYLQSL